MSTVFIRKDAFEQLQKNVPIKFFAFSEKYLDSKGYCDDSAYHFEICDGKIIKSVSNYQKDKKRTTKEVPEFCKNCKYGFYNPVKWGKENPFEKFLKKYHSPT